MGKWVIGKYIRLSEADRDLGADGKKTESESISHQKALIQNFINNNEELKTCEQFEFFDDGYSGTNFDRPSFDRLIGKIKKREINCVIVKDFSRFGRDYIELGNYLEQIFPFLGVRFISINDGYDSLDYKGSTGGLDVVMKNIVYDYYSKDLSVKVTTAKRAKMKRGEYIGGHVPYGLLRDPEDKHKLIIDPEAAQVVREIFDAAISGMRLVDIGRMLNEKGYETPAAYYRRKHPEAKNFGNTSALSCWDTQKVRTILRQEMYYGAVVGHKREALDVGGKHTASVPKEEQIIVEGMHPGIVTKEEFLQAQKIFRKAYEKKRPIDKSYPLYMKVRCGTCGRAMGFKSHVIKGKDYRYFGCTHARNQAAGACCREYIREEDLNQIVWNSVRVLLDAVGDVKKNAKLKKAAAKQNNAGMAAELAALQRKREKCDSERFKNVDQFMAGNLDKEVYLSRREDLSRQAQLLDAQITEMQAKLHEAETAADEGLQKALETVETFSGAAELTQEMVQALIGNVIVYDPRHVEIRWKFTDEIMEMFKS